MIRRFLNWLNPPHAWIYSLDEVERRCAICGQMEQYGIGDEFGHAWDEVVPGVRARHALPMNKPAHAVPADVASPATTKLNT